MASAMSKSWKTLKIASCTALAALVLAAERDRLATAADRTVRG
jgi:hypothetical protein